MNKIFTQNQILKFISMIGTRSVICGTLTVFLLISASSMAQNQGNVFGAITIDNQTTTNKNPLIYQQTEISIAHVDEQDMEITSVVDVEEGVPCNQQNPSNAFQTAFITSKDDTQILATDINVPADINFTLNTLTFNIWSGPGVTVLSADIIFYNNGDGVPGTIKQTQLALTPVSQTVIGNIYGFDVSKVVFDIAPIILEGQTGSATAYWVSLNLDMASGSTGYLESTNVSISGMEQAYTFNNGATWATNTGWDSVYKFEGVCESMNSAPIEGIVEGSVDWNFNCGERDATIKLYEPLTSTLIASFDLSIQSDGSFTIPNVSVGTYDVIVKVDGYLSKGIQGVEIEGGQDSVAVGDIVFGDINGDNIVDFIDLGALSGLYLSQVGQGNYNPLADANCDGIIDFVDLGALSGSYLMTGGLPPIAAAQ